MYHSIITLCPALSPSAVDCGPLNNPINGLVIVPVTTFNNMATYSCNSSGYLLNGTQTRTCQASGVWSNAEPTCNGEHESVHLYSNPLPHTHTHTVLCPRETLSNRRVLVIYSTSEDPPPIGTVASYICDFGHENLTGNRLRTCEAVTGWTGSPPVCNSQCHIVMLLTIQLDS